MKDLLYNIQKFITIYTLFESFRLEHLSVYLCIQEIHRLEESIYLSVQKQFFWSENHVRTTLILMLLSLSAQINIISIVWKVSQYVENAVLVT